MLNQIKIMDIEIPKANPNEKNDDCFNKVTYRAVFYWDISCIKFSKAI